MNNYVVYHLHSDLSNGITNIDSVTKFQEYVEAAKELGMKALGFSEHGSILEWVKKKQTIEAACMKYIHAEEFYMTDKFYDYPTETPQEIIEELFGKSKEERERIINEYREKNKTKVNHRYHVVLIAKNLDGVKELNTLSSKAFLNDGHFYYSPRITMDELENTSDNILVTTACIAGALCKGDNNVKERFLKFLIKNKDRCYLEIQHHNVDIQKQYNKYLARISEEYGIPLIAGTDTHALNETHVLGRSILQKSKDIHFDDEEGRDLTFKSLDGLERAYEIQNALPSDIYLKAIDETNMMADKIEEFSLDYSYKYPKLYDDSEAVLRTKIEEGIKERGVDHYPNYQEYRDRIEHEMNVFIHNNAIDFILLEEDYKRALREQGVRYGYSRGSVSGSIICWLLHITEIDSIKYNLNFERIMNEERVSLADVDSDWYEADRPKVREYLFNKHGLHCCNIITFNTIKMRGAIKDVGRALGMTPQETQEISNLVQSEGDKDFIDDKTRKQYLELFKYVDIVTGTIVSLGRHAAGLVVSPIDVDEAFGTLYISSDDKPISQIYMKEIDSLNFVKLDILGLDCVGLIYKTCDMVGIPFLTPDNMNFNDQAVWDDLKNDTSLVFQFESSFAGQYLRSILQDDIINRIKERNKNFSYIDVMSMANGAIRPAGASYRDQLAQGEYNDCGHPAINEHLASTLSYLVYQEQIISFLNTFCGFTMGEADVVRRHFSKKTGTEKDIPIIRNGGELREGHHIKGFVQTLQDEYGATKEEAEQVIDGFLKVIQDASDYLFSKNHSDPYSMLGYACAYLRHYYPLEFCTTALNVYDSDAKIQSAKDYINRKKIRLAPIKFGFSGADYTCDKETNTIYQGIRSIKGCNAGMATELLEVSKREHRNFMDLLKDISDNTGVNSAQLTTLINLNFFAEFGEENHLLYIYEVFCKAGPLKAGAAKSIKKDKVPPIFEVVGIQNYATDRKKDGSEAKSWTITDMQGLMDAINEVLITSENIPDMTLKKKIEYHKEYLGYVAISTGKPEDLRRLYITDMIPLMPKFGDSKEPWSYRIECISIGTGKSSVLYCKRGIYKHGAQFHKGDVIVIPKGGLHKEEAKNGQTYWQITLYMREMSA